MNVEEEVERLKEEIKRLGKLQDDGSYKVYTLFSLSFLHFLSNTLLDFDLLFSLSFYI